MRAGTIRTSSQKGKHNMFEVIMYNNLGCEIASGIVTALDEFEAVETFIEENLIIEYPGDTYEVNEI